MNTEKETTMNKLFDAGVALAIAGLLAAGGCAAPSTSPASGALERADAVLRQSSPQAAVSLKVMPGQVRINELISITALSSQPGYLYVFQIGSDNKALTMVFPNAVDGTNFCAAGVETMLPRPGWQLRSNGPAGVGYFLAVVAQKPQDLTVLAASVKDGRIAVDGPYGAAMATLREVAP